jgi:hypothetical protein
LNENNVKYLLIGGYAVSYYGYVRPTGDMDIWIPFDRENAEKVVQALRQFGFTSKDLTPELFLKPKSIIRMGVPPMRLEVSNYIDGVEFDKCYNELELLKLDDLTIPLISLKYLKINKKASGRLKDLNDLEHLP